MRVMVLVKATDRSEADEKPTTSELAEMGAFNEQLVNAGVMLAGEGLRPSSAGTRVRFDAEQAQTVLDGPFAETKELVAGFWIWDVSSLDEALEWIRRAPFRDAEVELRPIMEAADFGDALTPELRDAEQRLREQVDTRNA